MTSEDGSSIAFERSGDGPPIVLVSGSFSDRVDARPLAAELARTHTVINYDRRGRGVSGDVQPYAVQREIEDLAALIAEVGGPVTVWGHSSGAVLALRAAAAGVQISRLALYEPPFLIAGRDAQLWRELSDEIAALIRTGRRSAAVTLFQTKGIGIPAGEVAQWVGEPFWADFVATAHTLGYEAAVLAVPADLPGSVSVPTLVLTGAASHPALGEAARRVAEALPDGRLQVLPGVGHEPAAGLLMPVLGAFLAGRR
ncbi:MAG: alpha/beta fold hydrolase [Jatrophihabitans sp.]